MKSCNVCQKYVPARKYKATLKFLIFAVLESFSVDLVRLFRQTYKENNYIFIGFDHFTGWSIVIPVIDATVELVLKRLRKQLKEPFSLPIIIILDNSLYFTALAATTLMALRGIYWKMVLTYAPIPLIFFFRRRNSVETIFLSPFVFVNTSYVERTLSNLLISPIPSCGDITVLHV